MLAIPSRLGQGITQVLQQRKQGGSDQRANDDDVQILVRTVCVCGRGRNQMITLTEEGSGELQKCENQEERKRTWGKRQLFLTAVWGWIHDQTTEGMQVLGIYIKQDVNGKLDGACVGAFRVDLGSLMSNFQEKKQESDQCLRSVDNAVGGRLLGNNRRNSQQEFSPNKLNDAIIGLREEMGESRNTAQRIHETQLEIEQK